MPLLKEKREQLSLRHRTLGYYKSKSKRTSDEEAKPGNEGIKRETKEGWDVARKRDGENHILAIRSSKRSEIRLANRVEGILSSGPQQAERDRISPSIHTVHLILDLVRRQ